ncbi:zinc-binding dehydrogenase [Candidatus Protofrankia californiensis]|uniref:zinc-binding dehydrogenase n=1 Tax=Candidatus Protofrankia californiensis TaxID=1839754 RepID=UPI0013EE25D7|nr:zinc-binding dehydrogenase [Candidatus Protofrankia californiensis]
MLHRIDIDQPAAESGQVRVATLVDVDAAIERYGIRRLVGGRSTTTLSYLAGLAARGILRLPTTTFPLDEVVRAHQKVQGGHVRGKVVLTIGSRSA